MNIPDREIDLLVDGELDEQSRRLLLEKLDADGWKRCALAFLEAQSWRSAVAKEAIVPVVSTAKTPRKPMSIAWMARAASVLLIFAVGWWAGRNRVGNPSPNVVAKIASPEIPSPRIDPAPKAPGYLEAKLEREGFKVEHRIMIVPATTATGQRVGVPVEQTKLRFIGNRAI